MDITKKVVRKPFVVEATLVTEENIEEIAKFVGELRYEGGKPFIQVNRNVVPGVYRVHPGYWMTKMGDNIRCYNKRVFANQFCEHTPEIEEWVDFINGNAEVVVGEYGRIVESEAPVVGTAPGEIVGSTVEEVPQPDPRIEVVVNGGE